MRSTPTRIPSLSNAAAVAMGEFHSLVLLENGDVYSFGFNRNYGELGLGDRQTRLTPTRIPTLSSAMAVSAGGAHSLVLLSNGDVYSFGDALYGQLGIPSAGFFLSTPARIDSLSGATAIAAGGSHSLVLLANGDVYSFGRNYSGQLGLGDSDDRYVPEKIASLSGATAIAAGDFHSLVLLANGDVYSFGANSSGELGLGDSGNRYVPTRIASLSGATAVAAGGYHSLVLLANGDMYSFGANFSGQLGLGDELDRHTPAKIAALVGATSAAAGRMPSLVLLSDGQVHSFGFNSWGAARTR